MQKRILIFSYYTNVPGVCQAEWIDDRIFAFIEKGYEITLVSCTYCFQHANKNIIHLKTPALSPHGASYEYQELKDKQIPTTMGIGYFYTWMMFYLNKILTRINISSGEGRWTWFFSAIIKTLLNPSSLKGISFIYTTGGPPSAHLAGIMIGKCLRKKIIAEFQDPLSGEDIGRSKLSAIGLRFFEKIIIRFSDKVIYCTQNAMNFSRKSYPTFSSKIDFVYPGANELVSKSNFTVESSASLNKHMTNITYLGSLYQTRNLDSLMEAIHQLIVSGNSPKVIINVYGVMNNDIKIRIENFQHQGYILLHGHVSREKALEIATNTDVLLLVQHTDMRSKNTMPFKLYDYLHTGNLIWGLLFRNNEIESILKEHGHMVCQADDIQEIKNQLIYFSDSKELLKKKITKSNLTPNLAVERMLSIIY
jgi:hypothetical protein